MGYLEDLEFQPCNFTRKMLHIILHEGLNRHAAWNCQTAVHQGGELMIANLASNVLFSRTGSR